MAQLDAHIDAQIDKRILDPFVSDETELVFSTYDITGLADQPDDLGSNVVRNADFWAADLDLTGWSNGQDNEARPGHNNGCCLITRRHAITAGHIIQNPLGGGGSGTEIGDRAYFFEADGTIVISSPIVAIEWVSPGNRLSESAILRFDEDLPVSIKDYKILPADYASYLSVAVWPDFGPINGWRPLISCRNNLRRVSVMDWHRIRTETEPDGLDGAEQRTPIDTQRLSYHFGTEGGDSGSPVFVVIKDEPVYLSNLEDGLSGTLLALEQSATNASIAATDATAFAASGNPSDLTGYTLTEYDLAAAAASIQNSGYHGILDWVIGGLRSTPVVGNPWYYYSQVG